MAIILLLWLLAGALDEVAACVDNVPASNKWMQSESLGSLQVHGDDGLLAVMPNYTFSCEGVVKQWIVQWDLAVSELSDSCEFEIVFDFHVLRPTGSCSVTSVGKNRMVVETNQVIWHSNFTSIFDVSDSNRIGVREGDMVGLAVTYNQTYVSSCFFRRLTIAEQDDTYSLLTNEVHYVQESFDPDSITEFELECSREHRDNDDDDEFTGMPRSRTREFTGTPRPRTREFTGTPRSGTREFTGTPRPRTREFTATPRPRTREFTATPRPSTREFTGTPRPGTSEFTTGMPRTRTREFTRTPRTTRKRSRTRDTYNFDETSRTPDTDNFDKFTGSHTHTHTHGGNNFEATDFLVSYRTPLINAVVEVQPTTSLDTKSTAFSETEQTTTSPKLPPTHTNTSTAEIPGTSPEIITGPQTQDGQQESMMIPISVVAATIGGLLIATTGVITILYVCHCFRERKKTGGQPDCAISENKAYSSPAYEYYDDINCVNPIYENDDDEYIYMSPEKGIAVDQKKPLSPPQQYSMKHNTAYGASSLPNISTTTATAATIAEELSTSFRSQAPTASVGKYVGNCFIVEDSVYEVPNPLQ